MHELTAEQRELAEAHGVATDYEDWLDNPVTVPRDTVLAVLAALGVDAADPADATRALSMLRRGQRDHLLPPCVVKRVGERVVVRLTPGSSSPEAWIELETGTRLDVTVEAPPRLSDASATVQGEVVLTVADELPPGYHTLRARWPDEEASSTLIVTPDVLGLPDRIPDRAWGLATQLYSVRSRDSWGVGDLGDLATLATWSGGELGADYILVNPLSAAEPVAPMEPSPYLPSSRRFVNPVYIRVEQVPEYADLAADGRAAVAALRADVHDRLDELDAIDRDIAWTAKQAALTLLHDVPRAPSRQAAYDDFLRREGTPLRDFATWCALAEVHGPDWHAWPDALRHPDDSSVADFRADHADRVDFHCWLQWVVDEQLGTAQSSARGAGMRLGVMHDLAVGVHAHGADAWSHQDTLAQGISVGAPPDAFNQLGQDWSQPPWRPDRLAELAYRPYRDLIARLLRHAGAVRIDHIIGLFRLWWIPEGMGPDRGTYVRYDHEALIGILCLEGQRAGAVVVGEDLGNVEPAAREYLKERGIIGTSILWFERDEDGRPLPADRWREYSLASVTTHDLPPTAGYLAGDHVALRDSLGLLTRPVDAERAADRADREGWLRQLRHEGVLPDGADPDETVVALYRFLTGTPARLLCLALTDAVGDRRTQNQPGTIDEYPNWRVPLSGPDGRPITLEDVLASPRARALAAAVDPSGSRSAAGLPGGP